MNDASLLVQLAAGECLRDGALAVEEGEEYVVRGRLRPPPQDLRYELVPVEERNKKNNNQTKLCHGSKDSKRTQDVKSMSSMFVVLMLLLISS